ncbi:MAG: MBL fold metallo-hydrolase [Hyphomicrobiaceae bacterium]|nr:MBL fold metallo-hydrolase [Hyphomicrobiaceae bacterium]
MKSLETLPINIVTIPVTPLRQNCSVLWRKAGHTGTLVDPGGDVDLIMRAVSNNNITIEKIVLTHGHFDHVAGADELSKMLEVSIEGPHVDDKFLLDSVAETARNYGIDGARDVAPDKWLGEGQTCSIAECDFEVLHCPGHSPGSVVYLNRTLRFAIVGDVIFKGAVGRSDFPYGDHKALISNIKNKLLIADNDDIAFICGHGSSSSFGHERSTNPFIV